MRGGRGCCFIRVVEGRKVKRCSGCKVDLPVENFNKGTGPGGLNRHCRECQKAWNGSHSARRAQARKRRAPPDLPFNPAEVEVVELARIAIRAPWLAPILEALR